MFILTLMFNIAWTYGWPCVVHMTLSAKSVLAMCVKSFYPSSRMSHLAPLALLSIYVSVLLPLAVEPFTRLAPPNELGVRIGIGSVILAIGAIAGPPISETVFDAVLSHEQGFSYAGMSFV